MDENEPVEHPPSDGAPPTGEDPGPARGAAGDAAPPEDKADTADGMIGRAAAGLQDAIEGARRGESDDLRSAKEAMREMRAALLQMLDERAKVGKLRQHHEGAAETYALDFDRARAEIARRFDLIGRAGGA